MSTSTVTAPARFGDGKFAPTARAETRLSEALSDEQIVEVWASSSHRSTPADLACYASRYRGGSSGLSGHRVAPRLVPLMPRAPAPLLAAHAVAAHLLATTERRGPAMCDHRLYDEPTGMKCDRTTPHDPGRGCSYTTSDGSYANDSHTDGGHG